MIAVRAPTAPTNGATCSIKAGDLVSLIMLVLVGSCFQICRINLSLCNFKQSFHNLIILMENHGNLSKFTDFIET